MKFLQIKEIGKVVSGSTPKTSKKEFWEGKIPWVTPKEINKLESQYLDDTDRKITELGFKSCSAQMLPKGSILFTSRAPIGLVAITNIEVCTNQGFKSIILKKGFDPLYIYYALKYYKKELNDLGTGTTFKELSKRTFENFKLPIPSLEEQINISSVLSKIESLIKKRKGSISLLDTFLENSFHKMFGNPYQNKLNFQIAKIGDVCKVTKLAGFEYSKYFNYQDKGDIAVVRGLNVKDGRVKTENLKYIDTETSNFLVRSKLNKGDVVITYIGVNIGEVALIEENNRYHLAPNVAKITPKDPDQINSFYLLNYLMFNRELFSKYTTNTAKQALNMGNIREIDILLPSTNSQNKFAFISEKTELLKNKFKVSLRQLENLYESINQKIFSTKSDGLDLKVFINENYLSTENITGTKSLESSGSTVELNLERQLPIKVLHKKGKAKTKTKIAWEQVSTQQVANWIKDNFSGAHFTTEMLTKFLTDEHVTFPNYFTSEELKKYPQLNEADDLKSLIFSALNEEKPNPYLRLEQVFYNAETENLQLNLTSKDYELVKDLSIKDRSGIYFKIIE